MRDLVTVIWVATGTSAAAPQSSNDVQVARVDPQGLELAVVRARTRGAVVVAGGTEDERALSLGADEVVAQDVERLPIAIARARSRAAARRGVPDSVPGQELAAVALLGAAFGHEINSPLAAATLSCGWLGENLSPLVKVVEALETQLLAPGAPDRAGLDHVLAVANQANPREIKDVIEELSIALDSMGRVVQRVVDLTATHTLEKCDLCLIAEEFGVIAKRQVERVARLRVEITSSHCPVEMSAARTMAVLSSLLNNAIEAIQDGKPEDPEISLLVGVDDGLVVAEIADNGCGMVPEVRRQALNPFFTTRRPGALGMGLTFAAMHVRHAGGELLLDSEPGVGSSVRIFLPLAASAWRAQGYSSPNT